MKNSKSRTKNNNQAFVIEIDLGDTMLGDLVGEVRSGVDGGGIYIIHKKYNR